MNCDEKYSVLFPLLFTNRPLGASLDEEVSLGQILDARDQAGFSRHEKFTLSKMGDVVSDLPQDLIFVMR